MKASILLVGMAVVWGFGAEASWLWPFGGDKPLRVSKLIEPVSDLIAEAEAMTITNNYDGAVVTYRQALVELDRIEMGLSERASSREFATIKNKRAYVSSAIDSLMLFQAHANANAIAVCDDTSELERRYAEEQRQLKATRAQAEQADDYFAKPVTNENSATATLAVADTPKVDGKTVAVSKPMVLPLDRHGRIRYARFCLARNDYEGVEVAVKALLVDKPNDAVALNLRAAALAANGDFAGADAALAQSLKSNPRDYHTLYNMARLVLQFRGEAAKDAARRYYETGRMLNAPMDVELERCFR